MEIFRVIKLGTVCTDKATGLTGTLTHAGISMGKHILYIFQPKGVDDKGQPLRNLLVEAERLKGVENRFEDLEVPFEILGTVVTDKATGFSGMAISFTQHINGCFHVWIQPKGSVKNTNEPIEKNDFDLRGCEGVMIKKMNAAALKQSKKDQPSPVGKSPSLDSSVASKR